jgi:hypothetical protein
MTMLQPKKKTNKYQDVHFRNVDEFLEYLPKNELVVVEALRQLIMDCIPHCKEKLSYNVPFYRKHSGICFIWPSAVPWGKMKYKGVRLGFNKGYLLNDEMNYLEKGDRKQVYSRDFTSIAEIEQDKDMLKYFLFEAAALDEEAGAVIKKKRNSLR